MAMSNLIPSFYYNNFITAISSPYTNLNAYRSGTIDSSGNIIKPESSIDSFEYLIIKLKKIFEQLPPGSTKWKLNQYASAIQLFTEEAQAFGMDKDKINLIIEGFLASQSKGELSYIEILEDMTSSNLGGPANSAQYNIGGVSGNDKPMQQPLTRKLASVLGFEKQSCQMYDVCPEDFDELSNPNLKSWDEVPDSETKKYMQRTQRRSGGPAILIRDLSNNRIHKLNLKPRNISKLISEQTELNPDNYDTDDSGSKADTEEVISGNQEKQFESKGRRTMVTVTFPVFERNKIKEAENAAKIFTFPFTPKNNVQAENHVLDQLKRKLISANYKFVDGAKTKDDLKAGEFGIFKEGGDSRNADIHVGMEHPETKELVHLGIEAGWKVGKIEKQYLIRSGTQVKIPKLFKRFGKIKDDKIDVKQGILDYGELKDSKKRVDLWPSIQRAFGKVSRKIKDRYVKPMAYEAIRERPDDISIVGNPKRLTVTHHRKQGSHLRMLSDKLIKDLDLDHTHELEELTLAKSPSHGGSTPKAEKTS